MRSFLFMMAVGAALVAAGANGLKLNSQAAAAVGVGKPANVERFVMQTSGDERSCVIKREGETALSRVVVAPDCEAMLPGLSSLHYWREGTDGTVTLSTDGSTPALVFAQADGVAYESIEPKTPLIALISKD